MEVFESFLLPLGVFLVALTIVFLIFRLVWPWLEHQVTNDIWRKNIQVLLISLAIVLLIYVLLWDDLGNIYRDLISIEFKLLIIGAILVNLNFLIEKQARSRHRSFWKTQRKIFVVSIIGILVGSVIGNVIMHLTFDETIYWDGGFFNFQILELVVILITGLMLISTRMLYQYKNHEGQQTLKLRELELARLREVQKETELEALQSKINPHFLNNSLNTIAGLIEDDPSKAEQMTLSLSRLFRYNLNAEKSGLATIKDELAHVRIYLKIEKLRFEEKLTTTLDLDDRCEDLLIPKFTLQPLVENAIKHGISKMTEEGKLGIRIALGDGQLKIMVSDNGPAFTTSNTLGFGLQNIQEKLELLFPENYTFELVNAPEKMVQIKITDLKKHETA